MKAREFMTGSLITCSPEASVEQVAKVMRDRNTGDVLITDDGKLIGIVTDRDIAIRSAAKGMDPTEAPVRNIMSKHVVTGQPNWDTDKIGKTMGKHQIRRLPITENGMLVGIISLGDLALRSKRNGDVAKSLKKISEPGGLRSNGSGRLLTTMIMGLLAGAVVALTLSPKQMNSLLSQVRDMQLGNKLVDAWNDGQVGDKLTDLLEQGRELLSELRSA